METQDRINELLAKRSLRNEERQELQSLLENPMRKHINSNLEDVQDIRFWGFLAMWIKFSSRHAAIEAFEKIGRPALHLFIEKNGSCELLLYVDDYIYDVMKLGTMDESEAVLVPMGAV